MRDAKGQTATDTRTTSCKCFRHQPGNQDFHRQGHRRSHLRKADRVTSANAPTHPIWSAVIEQHARTGRRRCETCEQAHVGAVDAPHARRLVLRPCDHVLSVGGDAHRVHTAAVPLERTHLRGLGEGQHAQAASSAKMRAVHSLLAKLPDGQL
eukprot:59175-Pleurochrysis_carterae.AAC.2